MAQHRRAYVTGTCHSTKLGFVPNDNGHLVKWFANPEVWTAAHTWVTCTAVGLAAPSSTTVDRQQHKRSHDPSVGHTRSKRPQLHVVFAGAARNAERFISIRASHIDALGHRVDSYRVLVWEDGSADGTRAALLRWASHNRQVGLLLPSATWLFASLGRPNRLAFARNVLLAEALKHPVLMSSLSTPGHQFAAHTGTSSPHLTSFQLDGNHAGKHHDEATFHSFLVVLDFDCVPVLQPSTLEVTLRQHMIPHGQRISWDVLTANSPRENGLYYDIWALRSRVLKLEHDCSIDKASVAAFGGCGTYAISIDSDAPHLAVDSAFNGLAAYRLDALRTAQCNYGGAFTLTCEHVGFHECLRRRNRTIAIDPSLMQGCGRGVWPRGQRNVIALDKYGVVHANLTHLPSPHVQHLSDIFLWLSPLFLVHGSLSPCALVLMISMASIAFLLGTAIMWRQLSLIVELMGRVCSGGHRHSPAVHGRMSHAMLR